MLGISFVPSETVDYDMFWLLVLFILLGEKKPKDPRFAHPGQGIEGN